jgi:hypothetical protein
MKKSELMSETDLIDRGVDILLRGLGAMETVRFLAAHPANRMESVRRHRKWQSALDKEAFFDTVFHRGT